MSSIHNRVVTTFSASAGNAMAVMGEVASGGYNIGRSYGAAGQQIGGAERQLRAFGTTFRYALAGTAIFALPNLVRNYTELSNRLGDIAAIGTGAGGIPIVGRQLNQLRDDLLSVSVDTAQPIDGLLEGTTRLYSTLENVPPNRAAEMMKVLGEVANTSQAEVTDITDAVLGMLNAYGQGPGKIKAFGNAFRTVIAESAGMTGEMFGQSAGRLFQTGRLGNFSPATIFGSAIAATRFGGSQPSNINNLSQALLYLMQPPQANAEKALASIGLPQNVRRRLGGDEVLRRVLREVNRRGFASDPRFLKLSDDALADLPENTRAGSGRGADLLQAIFPRIQGRRIAAILATLSGPNPGAGNKSLQQYVQDSQHALDNANELDKANDRAMQPRRFQQAAEAMRAFGIQVATALDPILSLGAHGLTGFEHLTARHHTATRIGTYAAMGGLLGAFLSRNRWLGGLSRFGALGRGVVPAVAVGQSLTGRMPQGTIDNPFFVIVLSQLGGRGGPGGGPGLPIPFGGGGRTDYKAGFFRRFLPYLPLAAVGAIPDIVGPSEGSQIKGTPLLNDLLKMHGGFLGFNQHHAHWTEQEKRIISQFRSLGPNKISAEEAERRLRRIANSGQMRDAGLTRINTNGGVWGSGGALDFGKLALSGVVELDINYNQPDGTKTRKKVHVQVSNWGGGTRPQHRGRNRGTRR